MHEIDRAILDAEDDDISVIGTMAKALYNGEFPAAGESYWYDALVEDGAVFTRRNGETYVRRDKEDRGLSAVLLAAAKTARERLRAL